MEKTTCYLANPEISCRDEGDDGALLFNPDTDDLVVINPSGRELWRLLETPRRLEELAAGLAAAYQGVDLAQAAQDAGAFLQALPADFVQEVEHVAS